MNTQPATSPPPTDELLSVDSVARQNCILEAIRDIANATQSDTSVEAGFLQGSSGRALFAWHLQKLDADLVDQQKFSHLSAQLQKISPALKDHLRISDGIAGIAWLFEFMLGQRESGYTPKFNAHLESYIATELQQRLTGTSSEYRVDLDYISGLSGLAPFASRRLRQAGSRTLYRELIRAFEARAEWSSKEHCFWRDSTDALSADQSNERDVPANLGLSHGVPGVIAAMIPALGDPELGPRARPLILAGSQWLLGQEQDTETHQSCFGYAAGQTGDSRLGWCYGDLPIALTLIRAGLATDESRLVHAGHRIARHAARHGREDSIHDAGLCHGSAGIYLLYHLINELVPDPEFANASERWLGDLLRRYQADGLSGFNGRLVDPVENCARFEPWTGFLMGYSGVGLCLLVAMGVEPDWADSLLLG